MAASVCQEIGAKCVAVPIEGQDYCAVHRKCARCHTSHPDKTTYVCEGCGKTLCAGALHSAANPNDRKQMIRMHKVDKHNAKPTECGPVVKART